MAAGPLLLRASQVPGAGPDASATLHRWGEARANTKYLPVSAPVEAIFAARHVKISRARIRKYAYHESVDTLQGLHGVAGMGKNFSIRVAVLGLAVLISQMHLGWIVRGLDPNILRVQFTFDAQRFWAIVDAWGPVNAAIYISHFPWDWVHILLYSLLGIAICRRRGIFARVGDVPRRLWALVLPLAGLMDVLENAAQLYLLAGASNGGGFVVPASALCSTIKWLLVLLFAGACVWMWLAPVSGRKGLPAAAAAKAGTPR